MFIDDSRFLTNIYVQKMINI